MEQQLTIEQLKKAREIGATHWDFNYRQFRKDGYIYSNDCVWRIGVCKRYFADYSDIIEIDFTPLDEYYADKDADIRATGGDDIPAILKPQTGAVDADTHCEEVKPKVEWRHDDETGGLKPMPINTGRGAGMKYDADKPRMSLIPPNALTEIAKVMTFGADKYGANSWRKVENAQERYLDALLRHAIAYVAGERVDPESGLPTMAHLMCDAAFLIELDKTKTENAI